LGIENILAVMGKKRRHRGYDPGAVRAGERQYVLVIGHGGSDENSGEEMAFKVPCSIIGGTLAPIPHRGS
jgi:hypothetical protein